MRLRTFSLSLVVAAFITVPFAGTAMAQPDRDCDDFSSQEEAQDALLPGDPERLDQNDNGQACEDFDYGSSPRPPADDEDRDDSEDSAGDEESGSDRDEAEDDGQVSVVPRGGVDTGDGSSSTPPAPFVIAGVLAVGVAAGAARRRVRATR